jgi:hypothetical protein
MKLIDKAIALSLFTRLLSKEVERLDKKYVKLVKKSDLEVWDQVESLIKDIDYYEGLIKKVNEWSYDIYIEHEKSEEE